MSEEERNDPIEEVVEESSTEMPITRPDWETDPLNEGEPPTKEEPSIEDRAKAQGWIPPEEFHAEDKEFISAAEFIRRGELFDKIRDLKASSETKSRRLEQQIAELTNMVQESKRQGYEQAMRDLQQKRREAIEYGDVDAFDAIDSEYDRIKQAIKETTRAVAPQPEISEDALKFQERNKHWFNTHTPENSNMVSQAIQIDQFLAENKPYLNENQRLALVEKELKGLFPHRFSSPGKKQPSKVESSKGSASEGLGKSKSIKLSDLDDRDKERAKMFLSSDPSLTLEDFLRAAGLKN